MAVTFLQLLDGRKLMLSAGGEADVAAFTGDGHPFVLVADGKQARHTQARAGANQADSCVGCGIASPHLHFAAFRQLR